MPREFGMPADDRRLTTRVLKIWTALPREGDFPRCSGLTSDTFGTDCPDCLLIAIDPEPTRSRILCLGEHLRNADWSADTSQCLGDYAEGSLLRLATAKIPAVAAKRAPITFGGNGARHDKPILYRAILLPLSEDGQTIDHVLGAINFREMAVVEEYPLEEPAPQVTPETMDKVSSYLAFSSRKVSFAPTAPKRKPMTIMVR
jgi:hypothetical protein